MKKKVHFKLNHKPVTLDSDPGRMLLWVLRTDLGLTGTKFGCGAGYCGSCTVLVDNKATRSCLYPVKDLEGKKVLTIEGLSRNGDLHPLQKAFIDHDALQCGYCTPGMIMNSYGLLLENSQPSRLEIIQAMEDHLCRCGTYGRIIEAIQAAAQDLKGGRGR